MQAHSAFQQHFLTRQLVFLESRLGFLHCPWPLSFLLPIVLFGIGIRFGNSQIAWFRCRLRLDFFLRLLGLWRRRNRLQWREFLPRHVLGFHQFRVFSFNFWRVSALLSILIRRA